MLKSLAEFQSMTGTEMSRIIELGPVLITEDEEPSFVAQSVDQFETMVRRLRELETAAKKKDARRRGLVLAFRR